MEENTKPRIRVNAKQTSKGLWYFDVTTETDEVEKASTMLLEAVENVETKFKKAGKKLVEE